VVCQGNYCNLGGRAEALRRRLEEHADTVNEVHDMAGKWDEPRPVMVRTANCLSMCGEVPNLILHPDKHIENGLDADGLESFICQHLSEELEPEPQV